MQFGTAQIVFIVVSSFHSLQLRLREIESHFSLEVYLCVFVCLHYIELDKNPRC